MRMCNHSVVLDRVGDRCVSSLGPQPSYTVSKLTWLTLFLGKFFTFETQIYPPSIQSSWSFVYLLFTTYTNDCRKRLVFGSPRKNGGERSAKEIAIK